MKIMIFYKIDIKTKYLSIFVDCCLNRLGVYRLSVYHITRYTKNIKLNNDGYPVIRVLLKQHV